MPNGPESRPWVFADGASKRKLALQAFAIVRKVETIVDFERLIQAAADQGMELHSWNFSPGDDIVAVFYPANAEALSLRKRGGVKL